MFNKDFVIYQPTFIRKDNIRSTTDWIMSNFQSRGLNNIN